jgi:DNA-binding transcriptional regulator LsrR (DeoR family)
VGGAAGQAGGVAYQVDGAVGRIGLDQSPGVGLWAPGESTVHDVIQEKVRRELSRLGVCGEIAGVLFDADGRPVESELTERMISVSAAQLRAIPEVIALAYSTARSPAVQAAIHGGFVDSVVTNPSLAQALLAHR